MTKPLLKSCPFCGGTARYAIVDDESYENTVDYGGHFIVCGSCDACTGLVFAHKDDVSRELAERWNQRCSK